MTKAPLQASISLSTGEPPDEKGNTVFGSYTTNANGSFDIKSEGGWNSAPYYLVISEGNQGGFTQLSYNNVKNKQNVDVGDVLMGSYTFHCKVTVNPIDNSAIDFVNLGSANHHYNAGTSTQFLCSVTYSSDEYFMFGKSLDIAYKIYPGGVEKDTGISVLALTPDTLSVTINY